MFIDIRKKRAGRERRKREEKDNERGGGEMGRENGKEDRQI